MRINMQWSTGKAIWNRWRNDPKNITAVLIIFIGLFVGSLFVDLGQLITGSGFSSRSISTHDILVSGGKTWVAYTEPKVTLRVVNDGQCDTCDPGEALLWLRRIVPTLEAQPIDISTDAGKKLIDAFRIVSVPAFIFDSTVKETEFFAQAEPLFREEHQQYFFDINMIGMPIGRYLSMPEAREDEIILGAADAKVTLMVFSDFECQYCREYHQTYKRLLSEYAGQIKFVWKHLPLTSLHPQSLPAAEAAQCAAKQNQFMPYADLLFERQSEWGRVGGERRFKEYAWRVRGLDAAAFSRCLDTNEAISKIDADIQLAEDFHIESTPTTFINREFVSGAAPYADLKTIIDTALAK